MRKSTILKPNYNTTGDTLTEGNIEDGTMNTCKLLCVLGLLLLSLTAMTACHGSGMGINESILCDNYELLQTTYSKKPCIAFMNEIFFS